MGLIFLIVGLPTFFTGCNSNLTDFCPGYKIFDGYVYRTEITQQTCETCIKKTRNGCEESRTYSCYSSFVYASEHNSFDNFNSSKVSGLKCKIRLVKNKEKSTAIHSLEKYKLGDSMHRYKRKNSSICFTEEKLIIGWYVGLIFLSLSGVALGLLIKMYFVDGNNYNIINTNVPKLGQIELI